MGRASVSIAAIVVVAVGAAARCDAAFIYQNTFNASNETWTAGFGAQNSTSGLFQSTGGNPGGHIRTSDRTDSGGDTVWFFSNNSGGGAGNVSAGATGSKEAAYGGALSYDMLNTGTGGPIPFNYSVALFGQDGINSAYLLYKPSLTPTAAWSSFSVPLLASGNWGRTLNPGSAPATWTVPTETQFRTVLANLRGVEIRGNRGANRDDLTRIDNFALVTPAAVPEPSSCLLLSLCCAVGGTAAWRRRRGDRRNG